VVAIDPDGPHAKVYRDIAQKIWTTLAGGTASRAAPKIVFE
jgi:ATP-binding protein involved in chromosome partitioning